MVRRLAVLVLSLLVVTGAVRAEAVTIRDIVELSKAGLSDEVLVALIEADGTIFSLDAAQILSLREAGVSERVLVAMLRSGPEAARALAAQEQARREREDRVAEQPPLVVVLGTPSPPAVVEVPVPYPVFQPVSVLHHIPAHRRVRRAAEPVPTHARTGFGRFISDGTVPVGAYQPPSPPAKPVYWGWGGERRPDTWPEPRGRTPRD